MSVKLAKRYAKGLLDFSTENNKSKDVFDEMLSLSDLIKNNQDLDLFLKSPVLDKRKKSTIAKELFKVYSAESQTFIQMVIGQRREPDLAHMATEYVDLYNQTQGIEKAFLTSAMQMNDNQVNDIVAKAKEAYKITTNLVIDHKVDASLIGGFVLKIGDKQVDASIKTKLNNLKKEFSNN